MLTTETKRKIDYLRDVLVGKIPVPSQQIEQITLGLIYKFMSDIDEQNEELGGKSFFSGEYKKYAWKNIMDRSLAGHERVLFYAEGLEKMSRNKELPQLFRDIFKGAFLPFKDPAVLALFLKGINEFKYEHSEELGNAFEYLLSTAASQGDAGQFRTPRHIINFIVEIVDPQKEDRILDPACGTAGFLVSTYKHILKNNTDKKSGKVGSLLTSTERKKLTKNIVGYDISHEMVRLSLVNLYLHGFAEPSVYEYDTLSSLERWDDSFDCLLANPPFMTPRGGIKPHNRFPIQAKRSEVLFVDYITEHLTPNGKAGIIVPEGIIFQSGNVYKQLRKMLVEDGLWAVVSLPQGVFNPYSGVKTSILFFNNTIARQTKEILFIKVQNDGYDLGAQRKPIDKNDLPARLALLNKYKKAVQENKKINLSEDEGVFASVVKKEKIAENGEYNLSADRYLTAIDYTNAKWPFVELGEISQFIRGVTFSDKDHASVEEDFILIATTKAAQSDGIHFNDLVKVKPYVIKKEEVFLKAGDILISVANSANLLGRKTFIKELPNGQRYSFGAFMGLLRPNKDKILPKFLDAFLGTTEYKNFCLSRANTTTNISNLNWSDLSKYKIPLPPIKVQEEIVAELENYQKIVEGAKQIVDNYKPIIKIDPKWKMTKIGDTCDLMTGGTPKSTEKEFYGGSTKWLVSGDIHKGEIYDCEGRITEKGVKSSNTKTLPINSVLIALNGQGKTRGTVAILKTEATCNQSIVSINPKKKSELDPEFLYYVLKGLYKQIRNLTGDNERSGLNMPIIRNIRIPKPSIDIQSKLVLQIKEEQKCTLAAKEMIKLFEQKIKDKISEVWGE